jgi:hypothetical protein
MVSLKNLKLHHWASGCKVNITFFCKRGRHVECPGEWPVSDPTGTVQDCSFDIKMVNANVNAICVRTDLGHKINDQDQLVMRNSLQLSLTAYAVHATAYC